MCKPQFSAGSRHRNAVSKQHESEETRVNKSIDQLRDVSKEHQVRGSSRPQNLTVPVSHFHRPEG